MSLPSDHDDVFRTAVRREFGSLARDCNASLKEIEPLIYGFVTAHAVLTIGAYPGHFRGICVKLRKRVDGEILSVKDGADIGLRNFEEYASGHYSDVYSKRRRWVPDEIEEEIAGLAKAVRQFTMPFLNTPNGDWAGVRAFVDAKIAEYSRVRR